VNSSLAVASLCICQLFGFNKRRKYNVTIIDTLPEGMLEITYLTPPCCVQHIDMKALQLSQTSLPSDSGAHKLWTRRQWATSCLLRLLLSLSSSRTMSLF
jgi:hypothetical protein